MARESILALEFDGPAGLTGKMQSQGHGLCCLQPPVLTDKMQSEEHGLCCLQPPVAPAIFDTSFVSKQVEYNTAAFSHA